LRPGGTAVFVGAGGPMGQMHVQRAIELPDGPSLIVATDINTMRLNALEDRFAGLAEQHHTRLACFNPTEAEESLPAYIDRLTEGAGADDVVVSVPVTPLMVEAATLLKPDGMLVLFAGVPNGSYAPLDLSQVYLHNAQYTGTSGSALSDQAEVINKTVAGKLSPNRSVAAIGGLEAAREGVAAMMDGRYPGKVVIFPQFSGLPLLGLDALSDHYPSVAEKLAPGGVWTAEAEQALIELFWEGAEGE
jgi:threonine dehydrogenase-like Zn-dependent dehydrogenase